VPFAFRFHAFPDRCEVDLNTHTIASSTFFSNCFDRIKSSRSLVRK
jgi:hypothetical protein